ncbi:CTLH/CRA C-terminal to lish motif domain-containing protein [Pyronema omphalodes]|nr:CTLH/CRA C-terminal to lish motif domain-containing protein [Pyronema omphalodes]
MDSIHAELDKLTGKSNLMKVSADIDVCIKQLEAARNTIAQDPSKHLATMAGLAQSIPKQLEKVHLDHKEIYSGMNRFDKTLNKKFKLSASLTDTDYDVFGQIDKELIDTAIGMHLIREGEFEVAETFEKEAGVSILGANSDLKEGFVVMYKIVSAMRMHKDIGPAIKWAEAHASELDQRGSTLLFQLHRLQFIWLFTRGANEGSGRLEALQYARIHLSPFTQHWKEISKLMCGYAFGENMPRQFFGAPFEDPGKQWDDVAYVFMGEFCSLRGLSADSPLYIAATAGAIALPTLLKMRSIMKDKKTEWSSSHEVPVEVPLPPNYRFHPTFVCPVSKEQTDEKNPPMLLTCGHVIAMESLQKLPKNELGLLKCPYCPKACLIQNAKRVYF